MGVNTSISGSVTTARKVAVFAHYSSRVEISPSDAYLIECLRSAGYSVIVSSTCTNDPTEHEQLWGQWSGKIDGLLTRPNFGFDFASWSAALMYLRLDELEIEQLVLVNNSIYGPVAPLEPILEDLFSRGDLFGFTGSREFSPHLQSYFLGFNRTVIANPCFKQFWRSSIDSRSKWSTIIHRELTWGRFFVKHGFTSVVFAEETRVFPRNPLTFLWRDLVLNGFPFIKKSLFTHNYDEIDMLGWENFLAKECPNFDSSLISNDLN
jgi:lipopolysaccharide biosynthesis protein